MDEEKLKQIKEKISEITKATRREQRLSQPQFIEQLCAGLPGFEISDKAVNHWESRRQNPGYLFLVAVFRSYADWRGDWASACLQAIKPELWGEAVPAQNPGGDDDWKGGTSVEHQPGVSQGDREDCCRERGIK